MHKILNKKFFSLLFFLILTLFFSFNFLAHGQNIDVSENPEVKKLNDEILAKKDLMKKKQEQQDKLKNAIANMQIQKTSLINQLSLIDNILEKTQLDIDSTQLDIDRTVLEIKKVNLEIKAKEDEITNEKANIEKTLNLINKQDNTTAFEIILLNSSLSEFLSQVKYLENMNSELKDSLNNLKDLKDQLDKQKGELNTKFTELNKLKKDLNDKKIALVSESESKAYVLDQTESSEKQYQILLKQARDEQLQASSDISNLETAMRSKLQKLSKNKLEINDSGFIWPVPSKTINAYFHDPDYPFKNIFEHPAVDIKAGQGTSVVAAASGYVARAKDAGTGYSYIMLVHANGLSTVYGHVSKIYVNEDDYVVQGQAIGASGGLPGTRGAGKLTTGPHLHFEVRLNGIPVNPLGYLP